MTDMIEYALMAGAAYHDTRGEVNQTPRPAGWDELGKDRGLNHRINSLTGFGSS